MQCKGIHLEAKQDAREQLGISILSVHSIYIFIKSHSMRVFSNTVNHFQVCCFHGSLRLEKAGSPIAETSCRENIDKVSHLGIVLTSIMRLLFLYDLTQEIGIDHKYNASERELYYLEPLSPRPCNQTIVAWCFPLGLTT